MNDFDIDSVRETVRAILDDYPDAAGLVMLVAFLHTVLGIGTEELAAWVDSHDPDGRPGPARFLRVAQAALDDVERKLVDEPSARRAMLQLIDRARRWLDLIEDEIGATLADI